MVGKAEAKPGIKSTEFYVTIAATLLVGFLAQQGIIINEQALVGVLLPIVAYVLSRGWVKAKIN